MMPEPQDNQPQQASRWPWLVCWLMFGATALNYMDRQSMALVEKPIREEFGLDNEQFGWIGAAFYITYALAQIPAGLMADRFDVRRLYMFAVGWWSLAAMASAVSPTLGLLIAMRVLLGMGESFNWPCALKMTSRILPPSDRSLGNGIFNSGAAVGAVITPFVVPTLAAQFGWRTAFLILGTLGFVWIVLWRQIVPPLAELPDYENRVEPEPAEVSGPSTNPLKAMILPVLLTIAVALFAPARWGSWRWSFAAFVLFSSILAVAFVVKPVAGSTGSFDRLAEVVRMRKFWILVVVSITINVCWHFLVNWIPGYLRQDRNLSYLSSGLLTALPFLAADAGNIGGGWLSREVARRSGLTAAAARWVVMAGCIVLVALGSLVGFIPVGTTYLGFISSDFAVLVLLCVMAMGAASYMANYFAFCQEVSTRHTGLVVGILGGLGNLFAGSFLPAAGRIKDQSGSFAAAFQIVSLLPILGFIALGVGWGLRDRATGEPSQPNS
jgi:ACS family hexuronate transporter-like MFS transporter